MKRDIFNRLYGALHGNHPFVLRQDATKKYGIHPLCRFVACLRMLAYGNAADSHDEYLQLSESVVKDSLKHFCRLIFNRAQF